ncbi:hypothetical protein KKB69_01740 [Patescibacteria group bacterium]|nr:hypothetical protein [Patescibacteria group bacterium]
MDDTEEIKRLLKKNLAFSEESFNILKKIQRTQRFSKFLTFLKWALIIGLSLGSYYYIQPFIETFYQSMGQIREDASSLGQAGQAVKNLPPDILGKIQNVFGN